MPRLFVLPALCALACLPALVGSWAARGGGFARSAGAWTGQVIDDDALTGAHLRTRPGRTLDEIAIGTWLPDTTLDPPVHALFVWGTNPMVSVPGVEGIRRGLLRDDLFTVVHEQFLTDTARLADIVLPATTQIEQVDVNPAWGHLNLGWNEPAIAPVGESVSNVELMRRLAGAPEERDRAATPLAQVDDEVRVEVVLEHHGLGREARGRLAATRQDATGARGGSKTASHFLPSGLSGFSAFWSCASFSHAARAGSRSDSAMNLTAGCAAAITARSVPMRPQPMMAIPRSLRCI